MQKTFKSRCFLKEQRANTCTSKEKQCTCLYISEVPDLPDGYIPTVNTRERAPSPSEWQASGLVATSSWDKVRQQRPQQAPWREWGETPPLGGQWAGPAKGAQVPPAPGSAHPGGHPTEISAQLFKDVISRLPIRALTK